MKSVSGLYRLFWDSIKTDWPMFHHDLRRTGYTILKGDFDSTTSKYNLTFPGNIIKDFWDSPSIGDIDNDGEGEIVVGTYNAFATDGRVYAIDNGMEKWSFEESGLVTDTPVIDDIDNDKQKEIIFSSWYGGKIFGKLIKNLIGGF
ncbi:FG-GAP repeat protein [Candidatus Woesearchaeota archaeon]|nr:FG-GAP repeat protein [Candidatus Woesearchaeota archaeon]